MVLLARFVPPGTREPTFTVEPSRDREPLAPSALVVRAGLGGLFAFGLSLSGMATLSALSAARAETGAAFDFPGTLAGLLRPTDLTAWLILLGTIVAGIICGLLTAAIFAARHGTSGNDDRASSR